MPRKMLGTVVAALVVAGVAAGASAQGPKAKASAPAKATTYDVTFAFAPGTYAGTMTLSVAKGSVSGKMLIDKPTSVTGDVAGTLKGNTLALDFAYTLTNDQGPCTGRVTVAATMDAKAAAGEGTAHADGCGDPVDGTFSIKRAAAK